MSAKIIDGAALARRIREGVAKRVCAEKAKRGRPPALAIVSTRSDPSMRAFDQARLKGCAGVGISAKLAALAPTAGADRALRLVSKLNADPLVDAVAIDLPLPTGVPAASLYGALDPDKDAEGLTPPNYGVLFASKSYADWEKTTRPAPCTAVAVIELLRQTRAPLAGRRAVVVGRSSILGRPAAHLLSALDLTVTLCHSRTAGLAEEIGRADVLLACLGRPGSIKASWIKPGAIVIDAGATEIGGKLAGDVEPGAAQRAAYLTPVPGGVGPVTTAVMLANVVLLAEKRPVPA